METRSTMNPIVVVGGGLAGSATGYHLAKLLREAGSKQEVIILDQNDLPNSFGSSGGLTRITRLSQFEGAHLVAPAREEIEMCLDLQRAFRDAGDPDMAKIGAMVRAYSGGDDRLFIQNGMLMTGLKAEFTRQLNIKGKMAHGLHDAVGLTMAYAKENDILHDMLDGHEIARRFPSMLMGDYKSQTEGYFEPESGTLFPERIIVAQLALAEKYGAKIKTNTKVAYIDEKDNEVQLHLSGAETIKASQVIICAGQWINDLIEPTLAHSFTPQRQFVGEFRVKKSSDPEGLKHPSFIRFFLDDKGNIDYFYGTGLKEGFKAAQENGMFFSPNDGAMNAVYIGEKEKLFRTLQPHLADITLKGAHVYPCRYTCTKSQRPHIAPNWINAAGARSKVIKLSLDAGYGAKLLMSIGKAVATRALSLSENLRINLDDYGWTQPTIAP
jgi:sarcosine oxidase